MAMFTIVILILCIGMEYVKVVLQKGRMVGAVLIGDTDLEVGSGIERVALSQADLVN
jgi:NAD(P)H-nitrite reductase large subunit